MLADPFTGDPLQYRFDEGRFVVYGTGIDGEDNGGDIGLLPNYARGVKEKDVGVDIIVRRR
jgi:hypothetical protein